MFAYKKHSSVHFTERDYPDSKTHPSPSLQLEDELVGPVTRWGVPCCFALSHLRVPAPPGTHHSPKSPLAGLTSWLFLPQGTIQFTILASGWADVTAPTKCQPPLWPEPQAIKRCSCDSLLWLLSTFGILVSKHLYVYVALKSHGC